MEVRQATLEDEADVAAFTADTWPDHGGDYLPRVFTDWVETDGETQRTLVAEADGRAVGVVQAVLLTEREAWMQGMRVAPDHRGQGLSTRLHEAAATWARQQGATVGRGMVYSWNGPALAASRAAGFQTGTEFRWVHPEPDPDAEPDRPVVADPAAGWSYWQRSPARDHLRGLALAMDESWALQELTPAMLAAAEAETALFVVRDGGTRGVTFRVRDYERENEDGDVEHWAEYGVVAWADQSACDSLLAAVARDAATVGADWTRVLVPETAGAVGDAAVAGAAVGDEPVFVLEADLTRLD